MAIGFVVFGGLCIAIAVANRGSDALVGAWAAGVIFVLGGLAMAFRVWFFLSPARWPLLAVVRDQPHRIRWAYEERFEGRVCGAKNPINTASVVRVYLDDANYAVNVKKIDVAPLLDYFRAIAPNAAIGYSTEAEARFRT